MILLIGSLLCAGNAAGQINSSTEAAAGTAQTAQTAQVQGIWSISLKGTEQVTLALHQDGNNLFGSAMSESDSPWNAAVLGQISGDRMELTLTSLQDKSIVSTKLTGTIESENFKGSFVQADDQGGADSGLFTAVLINPDTTAYAPAKVESPAETSAMISETPAAENTAAAPAAASQTQPTQLGNPKYRDVHTMAGTVPQNLGVGFIGDGTAGAGGMGMG
ncbi:MAG TPA: hypothetical protein VLB04_10750 [Methanotrichaceae archaeon]|nr:hypothetical protein [Methanotrichaceae archaeon]